MRFILVEDINKIEYDSEGNQLSQQQSAFFSKSKIRDSQGKLLPCYHGSDTEFSEFKSDYFNGGNGDMDFGAGFYFTPDRRGATSYADSISDAIHPSRVYEVYLNITNPYTIPLTIGQCFRDLQNLMNDDLVELQGEFANSNQETWSDEHSHLLWTIFKKDAEQQFTNLLIANGFDGVQFFGGQEKEIIAFSPKQIKSILNRFPTNSANISEQKFADIPDNYIDVYRVGDMNSSSGIFFTDNLEYYDKSQTGYKASDAKQYKLNLNCNVWRPIEELNLFPNTWSNIEGKISDFEKYGIGFDYFENEPEDYEWGYTSTDALASAGKKLGYDIVILNNIRNNNGIGKPYTEYVVNNQNYILQI